MHVMLLKVSTQASGQHNDSLEAQRWCAYSVSSVMPLGCTQPILHADFGDGLPRKLASVMTPSGGAAETVLLLRLSMRSARTQYGG